MANGAVRVLSSRAPRRLAGASMRERDLTASTAVYRPSLTMRKTPRKGGSGATTLQHRPDRATYQRSSSIADGPYLERTGVSTSAPSDSAASIQFRNRRNSSGEAKA